MEKFYLSTYISRVLTKSLSGIFIGTSTYDTIFCISGDMVSNCNFIKLDWILGYRSLVDLWCIDYLEYFPNVRFELDYKFRSLFHSTTDLIHSVHCSKDSCFLLNSITSIFESSRWLEREIWDLYGIFFTGHNDLRRILTDYGFNGYPLRKDFPLAGFNEVRYDEESKSVVLESLDLEQNFRKFDFFETWDLNYYFLRHKIII